jgi:hypothetical protein
MRASTAHLSGGNVFESSRKLSRNPLGFFDDLGITPPVDVLPPLSTQAAQEAQATSLTTSSPIIQQVIAKNQPIMVEARRLLDEYKKNRALIDKLPLKEQRKRAMGLVNQKWPSGTLGIGAGKYNLDELAARVEQYLRQPPDQSFYRYELKDNKVVLSDARVKRFEAFKEGNRALRNYLRQFLPVDVQRVLTTQTVGYDSTKLLEDARAKAAQARATRSLEDAIAARTLAEQALNAATAEKNSANASAAAALFDEMDELVRSLGGPSASRGGKTPTWIYLVSAGAVLAALGLIYMAVKE